MRTFIGPKEETLMNYKTLQPLLDTIEWERDPGPEASYGDWPVETREEFDIVAAARLPIVRRACESGAYNGIVLLGGGEPGFLASHEIGHHFGIPVTSCAYSQMHIASTLCKLLVDLGVTASGNVYPADRPKKWRRKKLF